MRLGMNTVRMEFEDLGFNALYPMRARRIDAALRSVRGHRKELVDKIIDGWETGILKSWVQKSSRVKMQLKIKQKERLVNF